MQKLFALVFMLFAYLLSYVKPFHINLLIV
jgi:hypothetical protein